MQELVIFKFKSGVTKIVQNEMTQSALSQVRAANIKRVTQNQVETASAVVKRQAKNKKNIKQGKKKHNVGSCLTKHCLRGRLVGVAGGAKWQPQKREKRGGYSH